MDRRMYGRVKYGLNGWMNDYNIDELLKDIWKDV